jgi:Tfp pilus assembly major pilin PilA
LANNSLIHRAKQIRKITGWPVCRGHRNFAGRKFVRLNIFSRKTLLPGGAIVRPSKPVLAGSFIFAFGWRIVRRPSSLLKKAIEKCGLTRCKPALTLRVQQSNLTKITIQAMLIRISLIVAILAALAAGTVNIVLVKDKISTLVTDRDTQRDGKVKAEGERDKAKKDLNKAEKDLTQANQELTDAKAEDAKAVATAAAQQKRADDLSDKLAKTTSDRDDAQAKLAAFVATGIPVEQVGKLHQALKDAQEAVAVCNEEKIVLQRAVNSLKTRLARYEGEDPTIRLRADLRGKILVVDPKWDFVVLNIGQEQGVLENGELLVSRDGKLVAKVIVRSVEKDRCIANVVPGWKLGEVIEGDEVTPAHPAS